LLVRRKRQVRPVVRPPGKRALASSACTPTALGTRGTASRLLCAGRGAPVPVGIWHTFALVSSSGRTGGGVHCAPCQAHALLPSGCKRPERSEKRNQRQPAATTRARSLTQANGNRRTLSTAHRSIRASGSSLEWLASAVRWRPSCPPSSGRRAPERAAELWPLTLLTTTTTRPRCWPRARKRSTNSMAQRRRTRRQRPLVASRRQAAMSLLFRPPSPTNTQWWRRAGQLHCHHRRQRVKLQVAPRSSTAAVPRTRTWCAPSLRTGNLRPSRSQAASMQAPHAAPAGTKWLGATAATRAPPVRDSSSISPVRGILPRRAPLA